MKAAFQSAETLRIRGSGTKFFYGNPTVGTTLDVSGHSGVLSYEPSELVITARAGTRLSEIETLLSESRQTLAFDPPWFGADATLGGAVACGFSGPRRPFSGSVRDFVLGINCINGKGEYLTFGGQVIKNVAGYDVSRLMVGALGALGVICEVSLKVLPQSEVRLPRCSSSTKSLLKQKWYGFPASLCRFSGMSFNDGLLRIRLSGTENGIRAAGSVIGGETDDNGAKYWYELKEHQLNFFKPQSVFVANVSASKRACTADGQRLSAGLGWRAQMVYSSESPEAVFNTARQMGGHATMFRPDSGWPGGRFSTLDEPLKSIHERLKSAFDPKGILNPKFSIKIAELSYR